MWFHGSRRITRIEGTMSTTEGFTTEKFAQVREVLEANLASGADVGASVAVMHRGEPVVDIWGGFADEAKTTPWASDTLVNVWSTTKTMTFLVALMLVDRGELDFSAPVARYWPEFAANGKEDIEVRHLMSHTAGLSGWTATLQPEDLANWELSTSALAEQAPWWESRTQSGYHAVSQGHLIGEVVRRITGTTIGTFFHEEVAKPLNADFWIGLPESEEPRVSLVIAPPLPDLSNVDPDSIAVRTFLSPLLDPTMPHHRWWRAAEIPAANGHGNARSVALVQSVIAGRGQAQGIRFFSEQTADKIFETQAEGTDLVLGVPLRFGMGYGLSSEMMPLPPRACFWGGYGGSLIIMDQDADLTVSYMMNKMESGLVGDSRGAQIALTAALAAAS
jgi:CubicO group peptidase (beta-lactamase class C family)